MGRIPDATIQEIRDRADIVGLIGRHVDLKQSGRNFKGLCPFHDEKSPSFNVNPDRGFFHCFGCEAGGDVIGFVIKYENLTFPEAVRSLAHELGIDIPQSDGEPRYETEGVYKALEVVQACYQETLQSPDGKPGSDYFVRRGLSPEVIERFGLGFVPDRWDTAVRALERAGISMQAAETAGIVSKRNSGGYYDRLRGRATFPIFDVRGRVIGFGGRALSADQEPKYLNTPETPVFHKRRSFYGFPQALEPVRKSERAVICEGYFDAIALHRGGVSEAIATCGTALTADHATALKRRTSLVCLLFDGDKAGQNAMERALQILLPVGLRVKAVSLPTGQDPDDFLREQGAEALLALVNGAADAIEVVIRRAMSAGCVTPGEKADVVAHVATMLAVVPDPVERGEYARRLSVATATDHAAVEAVVRTAARRDSGSTADEVTQPLVRPRQSVPQDRHLQQLASIFFRHPSLATADLCDRMHEILPDSQWKSVIFQLLDAVDDGVVDADGAVDLVGMEARTGPQQLALIREIALADTLLESEVPHAEALGHILDRYVAKHLEFQEKELKRRMQDPQEDPLALLAERQTLLERKRAAGRFVLASGSA